MVGHSDQGFMPWVLGTDEDDKNCKLKHFFVKTEIVRKGQTKKSQPYVFHFMEMFGTVAKAQFCTIKVGSCLAIWL